MPEKKPTENKYGVNRSLSLSKQKFRLENVNKISRQNPYTQDFASDFEHFQRGISVKGKGEKAEHFNGSDRVSRKDHKKIYHISKSEKKAASFSDWQNKKGQESPENSVIGSIAEKSPQEAKKAHHISKSEHTANAVVSENAAAPQNAEKAASAVPEQPAVSETKAISPEMAQRMKRAAFLEQKNNEAIRINRASAVQDEAPVQYETENTRRYDEETADVPVEHNEEKWEQSHAPHFTERDRTEEIQAYRVKQASKSFADKQHRKGQEKAALKKAEKIARGDISSVGKDAAGKGLSESANIAINGISTASGSVKNADSAESAVMDLSSTLAAIEAKKMVRKLADTDLKKKARAKERAKHNGNRFGIDKYDEVVEKEPTHKSEEKEKYSNEPKGKIKAGNSHKMQEEKKEYGKKQKSKQIKNKRKEIYFNDNPGALKEILNGVPSGREIIKGVIKKKATSAILGGGIGAIAIPILLVIVVFILLLAFFGWLTPFDYTLAGDDPDAEPHAAETKAEILDGYTLMLKNCMDVTQAYYYLNYGDWYGGTYSYPNAESALSFSQFFSDKCAKIVSDIQATYADALANAETPEEAAAISNAMSRAITEALSHAMDGADEEYRAIIEELNDQLSSDTHRQHYEVVRSEGANGTVDADEFNGLPIVGTNHFGNVEIQSELSAEELLAYVGLYKSLKQLDTSESGEEPPEGEEESEETVNITPDDINDFLKDMEFFNITASLTEDNPCEGENCKRRITGSYDEGYSWEYYCDHDHQNLTGEIGACKTGDELLAKILELTNAEESGVDEDSAKKLIEETVKMIKKELDIDEGDFRKFGAADNAKAQEFYQRLIAGTLTNTDMWEVETPIPSPPEESP